MSTDIQSYGRSQVRERLGVLAELIRQSSDGLNEEAVHDIRVAVRRLQQGLEVFASLLPEPAIREVRRRLRRLMQETGRIRDRDIALRFVRAAGLKKGCALWKQLVRERKQARKAFKRRVERWRRRGFADAWAEALGVGEG